MSSPHFVFTELYKYILFFVYTIPRSKKEYGTVN